MYRQDILKSFIDYPQYISLISYRPFLEWINADSKSLIDCLVYLKKNENVGLDELKVFARNDGNEDTVKFLSKVKPEKIGFDQAKELVNTYIWELFKKNSDKIGRELAKEVIKKLSEDLSYTSDPKNTLDLKDDEEFLKAYYELPPTGEFTFGLQKLDNKLNGGIQRTELALLAAETKGGKTWYLLNSALLNAAEGKNVLFVSVETTKPLISHRLAVLLLGVDSSVLRVNKKKYEAALLKKKKSIKGNLIMEFKLPNVFTIGDLENVIKSIKTEKSYDIDFVVLDYADKFGYKKNNISQWEAQEELYNDLFRIAAEYNVGILTATQLKSDTMNKTTGKYSQAGSKEKVRAADVVINIEEQGDGSKIFRVVKARSSSVGGEPIRVVPDFAVGDVSGITTKTTELSFEKDSNILF